MRKTHAETGCVNAPLIKSCYINKGKIRPCLLYTNILTLINFDRIFSRQEKLVFANFRPPTDQIWLKCNPFVKRRQGST